MARRQDAAAAATETLHEIESVFDRLANWVTSNPNRFLAIVGALLAVAAAVGLANWWGERAEAEASRAVARVMSDYRTAMGATPGSVVVPEPADPAVGKAAREQAVTDLLAVSEEHSGRTTVVPAFLQAGNLQVELDDLDGAIATWQRGVAQAPGGTAMRGLLLSRLGSGLEAAGRWSEAAAAHAEAANIEAYPARHYALADAARSHAEAGERDQAIALFDRLESEAPELPLAAHVRAKLEELRLAAR